MRRESRRTRRKKSAYLCGYILLWAQIRESSKKKEKEKTRKKPAIERTGERINAQVRICATRWPPRLATSTTPPFRHPFATSPLARHVTECADTECEIVHGSGLAPFKEHNCHADGGSSSKPKPTHHATAHIHPSTTHTNRDRECNAHRHWGHSMPQGTRETSAVHLPSLVFITTATSCAVILANL